MEEIEYVHWEDVYKDKWLSRYNKMLGYKMTGVELTQETCNNFINFFKWSIYLIQIYMRNYGYYYSGNSMIIKIAFRIGFIKYGDNFAMINDMIEHPQKYKKYEAVEFGLGEGFNCFDDLNEKMSKLLEQE